MGLPLSRFSPVEQGVETVFDSVKWSVPHCGRRRQGRCPPAAARRRAPRQLFRVLARLAHRKFEGERAPLPAPAPVHGTIAATDPVMRKGRQLENERISRPTLRRRARTLVAAGAIRTDSVPQPPPPPFVAQRDPAANPLAGKPGGEQQGDGDD